MLNCEQFAGRRRDICRGFDDAGNPVLTPEKCEAYRRRWAMQEQSSRGLGDTVAKIIRTVTGGLFKQCGGCKRRQKKLNQLFPYGGDVDGAGSK